MNKKFKKDIYSEDDLWEKSKAGDISILKDKNISLLKNILNNTPLHELAWSGRIEILNHPEVAILKDNDGNTPLHFLAWSGRIGVLNHPEVATVKNNWENTPLHFLVTHTNVPKKYIKKLFPWYPLKKSEKIDTQLITKILNTPQSVRFIYE